MLPTAQTTAASIVIIGWRCNILHPPATLRSPKMPRDTSPDHGSNTSAHEILDQLPLEKGPSLTETLRDSLANKISMLDGITFDNARRQIDEMFTYCWDTFY
jgi:hypothetical protein